MHSIFVSFMNMTERHFSIKFKSIQTHGRGESEFLDTHLGTLGLVHWITCPLIFEQNGVFKSRIWRVVVEKWLALLLQSNGHQIF